MYVYGMKVHPLFDIQEQVWVANSGTTAPTLRELQAKLPEAEIVGYCPEGYDRTFTKLGNSLRDLRGHLRTGYAGPTTRSIKIRAAAFETRRLKEAADRAEVKASEEKKREDTRLERERRTEAILVACGKRTPRAEIAEAVGCGIDVVKYTIRDARKRGDSRALLIAPHREYNLGERRRVRVQGRRKFWTPARDLELKGLVKQKLRAHEIAAVMKTTRNSIIGRCYRKKFKLFHTTR